MFMTPEQEMIAELQKTVKMLNLICNDLLQRVTDLEDQAASESE